MHIQLIHITSAGSLNHFNSYFPWRDYNTDFWLVSESHVPRIKPSDSLVKHIATSCNTKSRRNVEWTEWIDSTIIYYNSLLYVLLPNSEPQHLFS